MKSWGLFVLACLAASPAAAQTVSPVAEAEVAAFDRVLPSLTVGRVAPEAGEASGQVRRQWPGTYFETAFDGTEAAFRVGPGDVHLRVDVDGKAASLLRPAPGLYRVAGLAPGPHRLRIDVASESQAGPTVFGGFHARAGTTAAALAPRTRQVEFIGDSHTVGYGNTSSTRTCSSDEVWRTTDTSQGVAPRVAGYFDADYQVNAISGRGIVRNYDGGPGDTLPQAYPYTLFDKARREAGTGWAPQVIVISLGTNDFTTPLKAGERWTTRHELQADFRATYVGFVQELRERHPGAYFLLWATDMADGEIAGQAGQVVRELQAGGEQRVGFVRIDGLQMSGCDWHPGLADDETIAAALAVHLEARSDAWGQAIEPAQDDRRATVEKRLINDPDAPWAVYGTGHTHQVLDKAAPSSYPAVRVKVARRGANPWDVVALAPIHKPIAAGDVVLVAVYLRAPELADGDSTPVSYLGMNQGSEPYEMVATAAVRVTNQWKLYFASARAQRAFAAGEAVAGVHLAGEKHVLDLGPVQVFDFGPDADPARLPQNE